MKRTWLLFTLGFALALLGSWVNIAHAAEAVQTCPTVAAGSPESACKFVCRVPTSSDDLVLTQAAGVKSWVKLGTVPASGLLVQCLSGGGFVWMPRDRLNIVIAVPPTPPATSVGIVGLVNTLWWAPVEGATGYRVYRGSTSGVYDAPIPITATRYSLAKLAPGRHYLSVSPVFAEGEGTKGQEVAYEAPVPGKPPTWTCTAPVVAADAKKATSTCTLQ
jgi:hypothetical protein